VTILALLSLAVWIGLLLFWHQFWRTNQRLPSEPEAPARWPAVVAIIPARNEATTILACLESLAAQDYPGRLRIVLSNDSSTDDTAELARELAATLPQGKLAVIDAAPLPGDWAGKMWALNEGVRSLGSEQPEFLWLSDADIRHAPATLRRLVSKAVNERLALASLMVRLSCRTFWEKLLVPPFIFFFGLLYPFRAVNDPGSPIAAAAGGSILIRRDALEAIGGLQAIGDAIIDDCALARAVKHSGRRIWLGLADHSQSLRDYPDLADLWAMVSRSAYYQLGYSPLLLALTLIGLAITFLVPPIAAFATPLVPPIAATSGILAWALMVVAYLPTVRYHGLPDPWALTLPLAALIYGAMTASSAIDHHSGRKQRWRGRDVETDQ
jgi:hopene-associated glycosyltransferase HpnB